MAIGESVLSGVGGAALSVLGNIIQGSTQYKRQKELMDKSVEQQKELFDYELQANSPAAVMARLREAGLNTNLALGSAGVGTSGSMPSVDAPTAYASNPMQGVPEMLQAAKSREMMDSQIAVNNATAQELQARAKNYSDTLEYKYEQLSLEGKRLATEIERYGHLNELSDAERDMARQKISESVTTVEQMKHSMDLMDANTAKANADAALLKLKSDTWKDEVNAEIKYKLAQAGCSRELAKYYSEQVTDIIETRAKRIAQIQSSVDSNEKRAQLLQAQFDGLARDLFESQYMAKALQEGGVGADIYMALKESINLIGGLFRVSIGSYKSSHSLGE